MRCWRISAYPGLQGTGGLYTDGRWHTKPRPVIYAAEHPALAMIETLANLRITLATIPLSLKLIEIEIDPGAAIAKAPKLPNGWQANEPATQAIGNHWLDSQAEVAMAIPSALISDSSNFLINAAHPAVAGVLREISINPFWFDKRFIR